MNKIALLLCVCMIGLLAATTSSAQDASQPVLKYYAKDSTKYSNDKKVVSLFGDAKVVAEKFSVVADELIYDSENQQLTVRNLHSFTVDKKNYKDLVAGSSFVIKLNGNNYEVVR